MTQRIFVVVPKIDKLQVEGPNFFRSCRFEWLTLDHLVSGGIALDKVYWDSSESERRLAQIQRHQLFHPASLRGCKQILDVVWWLAIFVRC